MAETTSSTTPQDPTAASAQDPGEHTEGPGDTQSQSPEAPSPVAGGSSSFGGLTETVDPMSLRGEQQQTRVLREPKPADRHGWWRGTGRRKRAVARVRMRLAGDGGARMVVQKTAKKFKTIDEYFTELQDRNDCFAPLDVTNTRDKFEVVVRTSGGGITGQAQAIRLGIARALRDYDPTLEGVLREKGFLTRDDRQVERKKYGLAGARRSYQFSKR